MKVIRVTVSALIAVDDDSSSAMLSNDLSSRMAEPVREWASRYDRMMLETPTIEIQYISSPGVL